MRRPLILLAAILAVIAASCGDDSVDSADEILPTAVPAPTVVGEVIEVEQPEIPAEAVLIGVSSTDEIMLRALPGLDQPLAGDVAPGTSIEPLNNAFATEDGLIWWQVRAGDVTGWIQPSIAYRGSTENVTDEVLETFVSPGPFDTPEDAARAVAEHLAPDRGASEIIVIDTIQNSSGNSVTVDLLGLQDDSVAGYRLIVVTAGSTYRPASVIEAPLCARGVTPQGLCL